MAHDNGPSTTGFAQRTSLTGREIAYLASQLLGRIATVDAHGRPRVVATGFSVNAERGTIELGGHRLGTTRRVRDIRTNPHVSLIVDDLDDSSAGWHPRGIEIRGTAVFHESGPAPALPGNLSGHGWMELTPTSIRSWGLE